MIALFVVHNQLFPGIFVSFGAFGKLQVAVHNKIKIVTWYCCSGKLDSVHRLHPILVRDCVVLQWFGNERRQAAVLIADHHQGHQWLRSHVEFAEEPAKSGPEAGRLGSVD